MSGATWVCCQIGSREHYAVPSLHHREGRLARLITDLWIPPKSPLRFAGGRLKTRFCADLADAPVSANNLGSLAFELAAKVQHRGGWDLVMDRNERFQRFALTVLNKFGDHHRGPNVVMSYSYAAREIFHWARKRNWRTVLAQIDPGPPEQRIVQKLHEAAGLQHHWGPAPELYWKRWREECQLADRIVVNSRWSEEALVEEKIEASKIVRIPLAYEPPFDRKLLTKSYPNKFSHDRPMRVLFLGQINLRKGIEPLLKAVRILRDHPIEFTFVGPIQLGIPSDLMLTSNVRWVGAIPHAETSKYYERADLMIFPTFSDGFGLTQLEAQSWRLPIVTSRFCGDVINEGRNGLILPAISSEMIIAALTKLLQHPDEIRRMSDSSVVDPRFSLQSIGQKWNALFD